MDEDVRSRLLRLSAIPTMATALLFLGFGVTPSLLLPTNASLVDWVQDPQWFVLNLAALVMALLLPLALVALYAAQADALGNVGLAGFVLAFFGSLLYLGLQFDEAFVWPILGEEAPSLLALQGPMFSDPNFMGAYLAMGLIFILGWIVFGVATYRAGVLSRTGGALLAAGMAVFGAGNMVPVVVRGIGSVAAAVALALLARSLWRWSQPAGP
jgi:hypothetical protein